MDQGQDSEAAEGDCERSETRRAWTPSRKEMSRKGKQFRQPSKNEDGGLGHQQDVRVNQRAEDQAELVPLRIET